MQQWHTLTPKQFSSAIKTGDGDDVAIIWQDCGDGKNFKAENSMGKFDLTSKELDNKVTFQFHCHLKQSHPHVSITLMALPDFSADHLLTQGLAMGGCQSLSLPKAEKCEFESYYQTMIRQGDSYLQIDSAMMMKHVVRFTGSVEQNWIKNGKIQVELFHFSPLEIELPPISFTVGRDPQVMMSDYAARNTETEKQVKSPKYGWNSWDYYRWTITEDEVLANAESIARDPVLSKHVKRIILDDGWQYCYGEWEANCFFPSGMESLAKKLKAMNFEPGLWFAPAIVEPHSPIAQTGYELLAKGESGYPCLSFQCMQRNGFVFDPTHPEVARHLHQLFARYQKMGYQYFKLDFLQAVQKARIFSDPTVGRGELVRKMLEPIYEAVKGKAEILGCNYPFLAGNKFVDAIRTGADIHARWDCLRHNTSSVLARFWLNRQISISDPDFALCRSFDTSNDPELTKLLPCLVYVDAEQKSAPFGNYALVDQFHARQTEILLSVAMMAGGAINLSDKISVLNKQGLELARKVVSARRGAAGYALDLFQNELPEYHLQRLDDGGYRILLINWSDEEKLMHFDPTQYQLPQKSLQNFWTATPYTQTSPHIEAPLPPRSCLLLESI